MLSRIKACMQGVKKVGHQPASILVKDGHHPVPPQRNTRADWKTIESVFFAGRIQVPEQAF